MLNSPNIANVKKFVNKDFIQFNYLFNSLICSLDFKLAMHLLRVLLQYDKIFIQHFCIFSGRGSVLTLEGEIQMEALISEGKHLKSGNF